METFLLFCQLNMTLIVWFLTHVCALHLPLYSRPPSLHTLFIQTELELLWSFTRYGTGVLFALTLRRMTDRRNRLWVRSNCNPEDLRVTVYPYLQPWTSFLEEQMLYPSPSAMLFYAAAGGCSLSAHWTMIIVHWCSCFSTEGKKKLNQITFSGKQPKRFTSGEEEIC